MTAPTDADRAQARSLWGHCIDHEGEDGAVEWIAAALADERERALASCFGRHEPLSLPVTGPGLVTCDGHELRVTYGAGR